MNSCYKTIFFIGAMQLFFLTSCAKQIASGTYTSSQVGEVAVTYSGLIKSVREVCVEHGEQLEDQGLGIVGGGTAGGVIGSAVGKGNFVPTAAGIVVGAAAGSLIEKKLKQQSAFEYTVQLENGNLLTVVQGKDRCLSVGQPVYVIVSQNGRSRLTPQ